MNKNLKTYTIGILAAMLLIFTAIPAEAAQTANYQLIETTYTVKANDTLRSIAEEYMKKNTYGPREIREFESGIKELNPELLTESIKVGKVLHINYWVKA